VISVGQLLVDIAALLLLLPVVVLLLEVTAAIWHRPAAVISSVKRPRLAVLIPAHDEALSVRGTVRSVAAQLLSTDRLLVVADNCVDATAAAAAQAGAEVIERFDLTRQGKGYALDFGVQHLQDMAPEVVVMIDADCEVDPGAIDKVARRCIESGRPVQAAYLMYPPESASPNLRIAQFAWIVKNLIRPLGLHRLGLPCQLFGSGMALPWEALQRVRLDTGHLVEDLKLGIDLTRMGTPPLFCPEALVTSVFPTSSAGIRGQRTRWEHGHITVILSDVPSLLFLAIRRGDLRMLAFALDAGVPPLAMLTLMIGVIWMISAVIMALTHVSLPLKLASATAALLALTVLLAWARYGRQVLSLAALAMSAIYAARKLPLYIRFLLARQSSWVRSKRD
jgi:cellulose synthase/poly-beta-1,6-N-acetylglucosamine synthase-like glycosyltransferase